jgi:hypothetical protein
MAVTSTLANAKGDIFTATADNVPAVLTVGANGLYLQANSSQATGLQWSSISLVEAIPINDLSDVTISSVASNQTLLYNGSAWINTSNPTFAGNLTVSGNLIVSGTTTTVNSATLSIADNVVTLNSDFTTGSPTENAGIEVLRGTSSTVQLRWNETDDCWEFTNDGTTYQRIYGDTVTNAQSVAYTLALADRGKMVEMLVGSANNLTVPTNSNAAFPVGTTITVLQTGAGQTTIVAQSGVTINATPGLKLRAQWSSATLIKRATDTWVALGDLAA